MEKKHNAKKNKNGKEVSLYKKIVSIKRVTKVVKGGRHFRFTVLVVVGDKKGKVGVGLGKSFEIPDAVTKGRNNALKNMVNVFIDKNKSIMYDYIGKFNKSKVLIKRAPDGVGIIASAPVRAVFEMAGIENIRTKSLGSNNKQNVILATIDAIKKIKNPEQIAKFRGKKVSELLN